MKIGSVSPRALLPALAALTFAAAPLGATSYVMIPDEALVDGVPVAAVVRVESVDREAARRLGGKPATEYGVRVEEVLKGEIPGGAAVIRVPGGAGRDGLSLKVYGAPRFAKGERALVFLEPAGDGAWRVAHFLLGAFHEAAAGGRRLAVRSLGEAREIRRGEQGFEPVPAQDRARDFDAFVRWVADRAGHRQRAADYFVQPARTEGGPTPIFDEFRLFEDPDDGHNLRWFDFDDDGEVEWMAFATGQDGVAGGGYSEFEAGLRSWNQESQTPVSYQYGGTTTVSLGLTGYDEINALLFNDPNDELPAFSCSSGGVLAYGGPWYYSDVEDHEGKPYHRIANADIVINDGLACFFAASPNASRAAEELFAHELGHTLGLGHSCGDSDDIPPGCGDAVLDDALMRAFIHDDSRGGRLNSDDESGLRALYGAAAGAGPSAPSALAAAASSTTAIRLTWIDNAGNETEYRVEARSLGGVFGEVATLPADSAEAEISGLKPATGYAFRVRALNAAGPSGYSNEAVAATDTAVGACVEDEQTLCLHGGRFEVRADWKTRDGASGPASVGPHIGDGSGLFWFFGADNQELLVKILDGCPLNGRFWFFVGAATNVQYELTVADRQTGRVKPYFNSQGTSASTTDTGAFATCP